MASMAVRGHVWCSAAIAAISAARKVVRSIIFQPGPAPTSVLTVAGGWSGTNRGRSVNRYLLPGEHQLICVRRHPTVPFGYLTLALLGLAVAAVLPNGPALSSTWLAIIWLAWGVLFLYTVWKVASWSVGYLVVTPDRILVVVGLVARKLSAVPLSAITDLRLRRSLTGRVFGYGDLIVESDLAGQPLAVLDHVPFPEQVYFMTWLGPDPRGPIEDSVLRICNVVPVSPFKIVRLLEQASADQATDSPAVSRELLYDTVADRLDKDRSLGRPPELPNYLAGLRQRDNTQNALLTVRSLRTIAVASVIALGLLLGIEYTNSGRLISRDVVLTLVVVAGILSVLLISSVWLLSRRIDSLDSEVKKAAQNVERQIIHDFNVIASNLSENFQSASKEPKLQLTKAPTLIELESVRVQPFASFTTVIDFLENHRTSAIGVAGRRGVGKTALLRWIKYKLERRWIVVYISAPGVYNTADFVRTIFTMTVKEVIQKYSPVLREGPFIGLIEPFRKSSADRQIGKLSQQALDSIMGSRSDQRTTTAGVAGKGISWQRGRQFTWTERARSHPELIAEFKEYLEQYRLSGGLPIAITIDELDKLAEASEAIAAINGLKDLFHIPNTHFIVSVSEDAVHRFAMRGIPFRDVFDSAFDRIVKLQVPSPHEARQMLARRSGGFPQQVALLCYAWSGGIPRDIIRTARACVNIRADKDDDLDVAELAPEIVRRDVAEIVDDAVTTSLEGNSTVYIDRLLALRHQLSDESLSDKRSSLEAVLDACRFNEAPHGKSSDAVTLRRLSIFVEIGAATLRYFSEENLDLRRFSQDNPDPHDESSKRVLSVVEDLAGAKAALAIYPAEAEWYLSRARVKMGASPVDTSKS